MRNSTDLDILATLEERAPGRGRVHGGIPIVIVRYELARNNATCEDPEFRGDCDSPWLQPAPADEGAFAAAANDPKDPAPSYALHRSTLARRSLVVGAMIIEAVREIAVTARRAWARYRKRRDARDIREALRQLDDHTLRDLGFDRTEISSVAAEMTGIAEPTRVRTLPVSRATPATRMRVEPA